MVVLASIVGFLLLPLTNAAPQAAQPSPSVSLTAPSPSASEPSTSLTAEETEELFSLHEELVNIPSVSGNEGECANFVAQYLEELGYYVEKVPVGNTNTHNVFAYPQALKDEGVWPEVLITSHIDTVRLADYRVLECFMRVG